MATLLEKLQLPGTTNLNVVRGDSLALEVRVKDKSTGAPIPLTGYVGAAGVRMALDSPVLTSLTVVVDQSASGANTGLVTVTATGQQTGAFPEFGVWDLQISDGSPSGVFRKTLLQGKLVFVRDVVP